MEKNKETPQSSKSSPETDKFLRTYYITGSSLLDEAILALGYKFVGTEGYGSLNQFKVYEKGNRRIKHNYYGLEIGVITDKGRFLSRYKGKSIESHMLKFFTDRDPIKIMEK